MNTSTSMRRSLAAVALTLALALAAAFATAFVSAPDAASALPDARARADLLACAWRP